MGTYVPVNAHFCYGINVFRITKISSVKETDLIEIFSFFNIPG